MRTVNWFALSLLSLCLVGCGSKDDGAGETGGGATGSGSDGGGTSATDGGGTDPTGGTSGTDSGWPEECEELTPELATDLRASWQGTLTYSQSVGGEAKEMDVTATLTFAEYSAPERHMAGLGYVGAWVTYVSADDEGHLVMQELFANGEGRVWAYNQNEADGGANELTITGADVCATQTAFLWRYHARFAFADLVDYGLYDYLEPDAPIVELDATERHEVVDGQLVVEASASGTDDGGNEVTMSLSGVIDPA